MANSWYNYAKAAIMSGDIDLNTDDIRVIMVMSNTTADTEPDTQYVGGLATLDECDGAGYARVPLAGEAVNVDLVNNRGEFDANDLAPAWAALGVGTRQNVGLIIYKHVGLDAVNPLILWIDTLGGAITFPFDGNGGAVNITWNAEGIAQVG